MRTMKTILTAMLYALLLVLWVSAIIGGLLATVALAKLYGLAGLLFGAFCAAAALVFPIAYDENK